MGILVEDIIQQLQEIHTGKTWIGSTFDTKLSSISQGDAFRRPIPDLHCVAEILSHLTVWRNDAIIKMETGRGSITEASETNWLPIEKLRAHGWDRIKADHQESLARLIGLLKTKEDSFLNKKYHDTDYKGEYEYKFVIRGMLHHDLYHLGQLGLIIKFLRSSD